MTTTRTIPTALRPNPTANQTGQSLKPDSKPTTLISTSPDREWRKSETVITGNFHFNLPQLGIICAVRPDSKAQRGEGPSFVFQVAVFSGDQSEAELHDFSFSVYPKGSKGSLYHMLWSCFQRERFQARCIDLKQLLGRRVFVIRDFSNRKPDRAHFYAPETFTFSMETKKQMDAWERLWLGK